jgi:hypothetical protein
MTLWAPSYTIISEFSRPNIMVLKHVLVEDMKVTHYNPVSYYGR